MEVRKGEKSKVKWVAGEQAGRRRRRRRERGGGGVVGGGVGRGNRNIDAWGTVDCVARRWSSPAL